MPADECIHMLERSQCAYCAPRRNYAPVITQEAWEGMADVAEEAEASDFGPWVEALWGADCRGCGGKVRPGDMIRFSNAEDAFVCRECGSPETA
jgi:hypothetical protein